MNKCMLIGRLVRDPEVRTGEKTVGKFTLAVNRDYNVDQADFIPCTCFGKRAEFAEKYLKKGTKVSVEGRWQTGRYEKDGKAIYTNDCIVDRVEFCESKKKGESKKDTPAEQNTTDDGFIPIEDFDEELPFS